MDSDREIARRIREIREDSDLTQEQVASLLRMSQSSYSRRENGRVYFSAGEVAAFCRVTKSDVSRIVF